MKYSLRFKEKNIIIDHINNEAGVGDRFFLSVSEKPQTQKYAFVAFRILPDFIHKLT